MGEGADTSDGRSGDRPGIVELRLRIHETPPGFRVQLAVRERRGDREVWVTVLRADICPVLRPGSSRATTCRDLLRDVIQAGYAARRLRGER